MSGKQVHVPAPSRRSDHDDEISSPAPWSISHDEYEKELHGLQVELVKLQRHFIGCRDKILVLLEGRDAAGKDGAIKRIIEHLSPRETRVVALGRPSDRDLGAWYFQRYVPHLPVAEELLIFNRSWYNRAGSSVPTNRPTTAIVETGPYCFTRNPIYLGMMLGLVGLAIALNSLWLVLTLWPLPCTCAALAVMLCAKPAVAGKMLRRAVPSTLPRDRRMNYRQHGC